MLFDDIMDHASALSAGTFINVLFPADPADPADFR